MIIVCEHTFRQRQWGVVLWRFLIFSWPTWLWVRRGRTHPDPPPLRPQPTFSKNSFHEIISFWATVKTVGRNPSTFSSLLLIYLAVGTSGGHLPDLNSFLKKSLAQNRFSKKSLSQNRFSKKKSGSKKVLFSKVCRRGLTLYPATTNFRKKTF